MFIIMLQSLSESKSCNDLNIELNILEKNLFLIDMLPWPF